VSEPDAGDGPEAGKAPLLLVVNGDASPEEVAALVAVLQAVASAGSTAPPAPLRPEWGAPRRLLHPAYRPVPGAWRSSALPR
jgi:hypothetical protein